MCLVNAKRLRKKRSIVLGKVFYPMIMVLMLAILITTTTGLMESSLVEASGTRTLGSLQIGDRVMDPTWDWEHRTLNNYSGTGVNKPVTWIVVAKDHYEADSVTLLAEELIGRFDFDDSTNRYSHWGCNNWGYSGTPNATRGLRPWLNSRGIHSGEGFYHAFSKDFQAAVVPVTIPNKHWEEGDDYITQDRVFIPSTTELGDTVHHFAYEIGMVYPFFSGASNVDRIASLEGKKEWYWTRSPASTAGYDVYLVTNGGSFSYVNYFGGPFMGVRPALNLKSVALVSETPNADGVYELFVSDLVPDEREWIKDKAADAVASALAYNSNDELTGAFPGFGVWQSDGTTWNQMVGNEASALAYDSNDNLAGAFPGFGVHVFDGQDWTELADNDATALAYNAAGELTANFPGWGIYHHDGAGWAELEGTEADALTYNASGNLVASFPGAGVYERVNDQWVQLGDVAANTLAAGNELAGSFTGFGIYVYDGVPLSWSELADVAATSLAYNSKDDLAGAFGLFGVWYYVEVE